MKKFIPLSTPTIGKNEMKYLKECLDTAWLSSAGKFVELFEQRISDYTKSENSIACMNGTSALHISLILAGVGMDDEVIVPSLTFIAPVNAIKYVGAEPVFMDSKDDFNIDIEKTINFIKNETKLVADKNSDKPLTINKLSNRRVSAIIVVHIFGNTVLLDDLVDICNERNIKIIEDSSESLGSRFISGKYNEKHSGTVGDFGCLSFNGNKIITCGAGGMILTSCEEDARRARYYTTQAKNDHRRFVHDEVGYNYRMSNIQAAIGCAQLETIDNRLEKKIYIHNKYSELLSKNIDFDIYSSEKYSLSNYWLTILKIKNPSKCSPESLMESLEESNIESRPIWFLNHLQNPYKECQNYFIENSYLLVKNSLCLPSSLDLTEENIERVVEKLIA